MSIKTDAQLKAELDTTFYTNGANLSTGALTNTHLTNAIESKVSVIDAETINGVKTFGSFPVTPSSAPTTDYQVANKKYVDDNEVDGLWEVDAEQLIMLSADQLGMQNQLIEDVLDPVKNQDAATKKYVDDNEVLLKTKIELTAANVNSLGTAFELLAAPGAGFNYKVIGISVKMITTTILDAGIQTLRFSYGTKGDRIGELSNAEFEGTAGISTKFNLVLEDKNVFMGDNDSVKCVLNSGADPTGDATMEVTIYYTLETY
jgi:hypothetical protein